MHATEVVFASIRAAAITYGREIRSLRGTGPYLIGRICRGGAVALEIAANLCQAGEADVRLCLLEYFHPDIYHYPGYLILLFGSQSPEQFQQWFRWGEPGWHERFVRTPAVIMVDGEYEVY